MSDGRKDNFGISGTVVLCTAAGLVAAERLARGVKTAGEQLTGGAQEAATTFAAPMAELATPVSRPRPAVNKFAAALDGLSREIEFYLAVRAEPWPYKLLPTGGGTPRPCPRSSR